MISSYGYDNFFPMLGAGIALIVLGFWLDSAILTFFCLLTGFPLSVFTIWFFRDPERAIPAEAQSDERTLLAPADGEVVQIVPEREERAVGGPAVRISIFLSPIDVHVNRTPAAGRIIFADYRPGRFMAAYKDHASEQNEQTIIGLENSHGRILFKQITGFLARRIVSDLKEGDEVQIGARFGMMKFGSRMDVIVPEGSEIFVSEGGRVKAGQTILGRLPGKNVQNS